MIKISGKVDKLNPYKRFSGNISVFIYRTYSGSTYFAFFYVLANGEKYKLKENVKTYKYRKGSKFPKETQKKNR